MASVVFSTDVGGDGSTVTDDGNPSTGLALGGHRTRFVPALAQVVAVAQFVVSTAGGVPNAIHAPVRVATTADITLSGTQTIDGVSVAAGNRVLVKNQATASQNGIYVVASGTWTRATDNDVTAEFAAMKLIPVQEGTANSQTVWFLTTLGTVTVGTTSLAYARMPSLTKTQSWTAAQTFTDVTATGNLSVNGTSTTGASTINGTLTVNGDQITNGNIVFGTTGTERQLAWNFAGGNTAILYGRDSDDEVGLYDLANGTRAIFRANGNCDIGRGTGNTQTLHGSTTITNGTSILAGSGIAGSRTDIGGQSIELGAVLPSDQATFVDFHATAAAADYNARITRGAGANGAFTLAQEGSGVIQLLRGATAHWQLASDGSVSSVIPGGSTLLPDFVCRAWVNFNGTGTVAIRASGNVSSITDNGVGDYTANLTTAMPDANFSPQLTDLQTAFGAGTPRYRDINALTSSTVRIRTGARDGGAALGIDVADIYLAIFR